MYDQYDNCNSEWSENATDYGYSNAGQIYYMKRDPDAIKLSRPVPPSFRHLFDESRKSVNVLVYKTSTTPKFRIRNAITGMYYPKYRVGTLDENRFFKVCWSMGSVSEGEKLGPLTLFFNDPEECEKHMLTRISAEQKADWRERQIAQYRTDAKYKDVAGDDEVQKQINHEFRRVIIVK